MADHIAWPNVDVICGECGWAMCPLVELAEHKVGGTFKRVVQCRNQYCSKTGILYELEPESAIKLKLYTPEEEHGDHSS